MKNRRWACVILAMSMAVMTACNQSGTTATAGNDQTAGTAAEETVQAAGTTAGQEENASGRTGTFYAETKGFGGTVSVYVTLENGTITDVAAVGTDETIGKGSVAIEELPGRIVEANGTEVDGVSGATVTSNAIKEAVEKAIESGEEREYTAPTADIRYQSGTYTASAFGHNFPTSVEVTFTEDRIAEITVTEDKSDVAMSVGTKEEIPARILAAQSLNVDIVSGATESSNAIINAVADCVEQAAGAEAVTALKSVAKEAKTPENLTYTADVVVVGGGGSGLTTAYNVASQGYSVVILEASDILGGMTNVCGGGSLSIGSAVQREDGVYESEEEVKALQEAEYEILYKASDYQANAAFLHHLDAALGEYVDWAMEAGISYSSSGKTAARLMNKGSRFDTLLAKMEEQYDVTILTGTRGTDLLTDETGAVTGVVGTNKTGGQTTVEARAVVLCTGGFLANEEMVEEHIPQYTEYFENWFGSTYYQGDGIRMAWAAGAAVGEFGVQPHDDMIPQAIHSLGISTHTPVSYSTAAYMPTLWVNSAGSRFINEDVGNGDAEKHGAVTMAQGIYYTIMDQSTVDTLRTEGSPIGGWMSIKDTPLADLQSQIDSVVELGYAYRADTLEELAAMTGMDAETLTAQVERYNEIVANGEDPDFGTDAKYLVYDITEAPYYAFANVTRVLAAYGGLDIGANMEVLDASGKPIPGLYAAGLDAGSFMGNVYSVTTTTAGFSVCSGYMAGNAVAEYLGR